MPCETEKQLKTGKISVLMGIYNCADTLPNAIESIQAQTYTNWELILCDDCSTDATCSVAKQYADSDSRIKLIQNETNSKLAFTLNHCLDYATGEFIARMDGDDRSAPDRFEKQIHYLQEHPEIDLVGTAMQRFYNDGSLGMIDYAPEIPDKYTMHRTTPFKHATVMMRTKVLRGLGGYTVLPRTIRGQDRDLWYRFFAAGYHGANLQEPLYWVREDIEAIRRRTFHDRWMDFQTNLYGYRLLHYPVYWYPRLLLELSKALVPMNLVLKYRAHQAKNQK